MYYAGFWKRLLAAIIDSIILIPVGYVATMIGNSNEESLQAFIASTIFSWLYFSIFESQGWQATPGKHFMKIKVVDYSGNKISFARATARYFSKFLSALILFIGYLMAGFTTRKQALHDLIAETLVINSNSLEIKSSNYEDKTVSIKASHKNELKAVKIIMAGFDTRGNVLRLSFDLDDPKLNNFGLILGRDSTNSDLYISDQAISRRHAKIYKKNNELWIEDLGSTNGIIVNGKQINSGQSSILSINGSLSIGGIELTLGRG